MTPVARIAGPLALIVVGVLAVWSGVGYGIWDSGSPGAGLFPVLAGAMLCICAAAAALAQVRAGSDPDDAPAAPASAIRLAGYIAGLAGFALLLEPLGAIIAIAFLFVWILLVIERLPWRLVAAVTTGSALGVWLLFDLLLNVPLPRGVLA